MALSAQNLVGIAKEQGERVRWELGNPSASAGSRLQIGARGAFSRSIEVNDDI